MVILVEVYCSLRAIENKTYLYDSMENQSMCVCFFTGENLVSKPPCSRKKEQSCQSDVKVRSPGTH